MSGHREPPPATKAMLDRLAQAMRNTRSAGWKSVCVRFLKDDPEVVDFLAEWDRWDWSVDTETPASRASRTGRSGTSPDDPCSPTEPREETT